MCCGCCSHLSPQQTTCYVGRKKVGPSKIIGLYILPKAKYNPAFAESGGAQSLHRNGILLLIDCAPSSIVFLLKNYYTFD